MIKYYLEKYCGVCVNSQVATNDEDMVQYHLYNRVVPQRPNYSHWYPPPPKTTYYTKAFV